MRLFDLSFPIVFLFLQFLSNETGDRNVQITQQPDGKTLFNKYNCKSCHTKGGTGAVGDLRKAAEKYTDDQMRAYIRKPLDFNNKKMPSFEKVIPDKDLDLLIQYIRELASKK